MTTSIRKLRQGNFLAVTRIVMLLVIGLVLQPGYAATGASTAACTTQPLTAPVAISPTSPTNNTFGTNPTLCPDSNMPAIQMSPGPTAVYTTYTTLCDSLFMAATGCSSTTTGSCATQYTTWKASASGAGSAYLPESLTKTCLYWYNQNNSQNEVLTGYSYVCCQTAAQMSSPGKAQTAAANLPQPAQTNSVTSAAYKVPAANVAGALTNATVDGSKITGTFNASNVNGSFSPTATPNVTVPGSDVSGAITSSSVTIPGNQISSTVGSASSIICNNPTVQTGPITPAWNSTNAYFDSFVAMSPNLESTTNGGQICPGKYTISVTCSGITTKSCGSSTCAAQCRLWSGNNNGSTMVAGSNNAFFLILNQNASNQSMSSTTVTWDSHGTNYAPIYVEVLIVGSASSDQPTVTNCTLNFQLITPYYN